MIEGLDVRPASIAEAEVALAIGLRDDMVETPADYDGELAEMKAKGLTMLCANPDLVVHRGERLVYCAGALAARPMRNLGGDGDLLRQAAPAGLRIGPGGGGPGGEGCGQTSPKRPLAVGDGLLTDIKGANGAGLEALFIADGVHGEDIEPYTAEHLAALFARFGAKAGSVTRRLAW